VSHPCAGLRSADLLSGAKVDVTAVVTADRHPNPPFQVLIVDD